MQAVIFYLVYPLIWIISRLPFKLVYFISDCVYYILFYLVKYRREVIIYNIQTAFPDASPERVNEILKKSTRHFCDIFIEMIKSMGMNKEEMATRFKYTNIDYINDLYAQKKQIIVMFGHQGSYEWTMILDELTPYKILAVYKPIKNKYFDKLIKDIRGKFNSTLVPMSRASSSISNSIKKEELGVYGLVADQAPALYRASHFTQFFNKTSAVFMGGERLARKHNTVVLFLAVTKTKRGYYESKFVEISPEASKTKDWEITDLFLEALEKQIKIQPEYYLWSHKRWKYDVKDLSKTPKLSPKVPQ